MVIAALVKNVSCDFQHGMVPGSGCHGVGATDRPSLRGLPVHDFKAHTDTGKPEDKLIRGTLSWRQN